MSQKKKNINTNSKPKNEKKEKCEKFLSYALLFLSAEVLISLVISWIFGGTEYTKISDNFLTAFLQNYNYLLGTVCIIPILVYIYSKIKNELNKRLISESQMLMYGFLGFIITLISAISVCAIIYPINASMLYGVNSKTTVGIFIVPVVTLIIESIVYGALIIPNLIKNKQFWKVVRRNLPIILMVMFLIWTFISCMLAPEAADNILGEKAPKGDEVLTKTLNGCYNLKDGFWAFLMYGSIMLGALMLGKDRIKEKKVLIKIFVFSILVLSILTLLVPAFATDSKTYMHWYIFPQRGLFRNSNHFAYVLSMSVIASVVLAITEKNIFEKVSYVLAFTIMTYMLIFNDTFGGYLGVAVALITIVIYGIGNLVKAIINSRKDENKKSKLFNDGISPVIVITVIATIFMILTFNVRYPDTKNVIALKNIRNFTKDIGIFGGFMITEENASESNIQELDESITKAGSGRGETWLKVLELIKQRPLFGYGLECLLFQFNGQFGINEGRTHNLLLQLLGTIGIPGTIMYFSALAIIFIRLLKNWKTWDDIEKICVFVGISYMVTALTGNSSYYTSPYFMMFLGFVALVPWKREEPTNL